MTEAQYVDRLLTLWPAEDDADAPDGALYLADEAVSAYPDSAKLWVMRGNLIELGSGQTTHTLADALSSYERAIKIDPNCVEAYEMIGYFLANVMDESALAEPYFRKAESLRNN